MFQHPWLRLYARAASLITAFSFLTSSIFATPAIAQAVLNLPQPGVMVPVTSSYNPTIVRGLTLHQDDPLKFDFIVDTGDEQLEGAAFEAAAQKQIKYFLAALTIPEDQMWVNLSPYEKDRIIPEALGVTDLGVDLLAQDYMLKQLTASLMYPEEQLGEEFWNRVYARAQKEFGTTDIPVNTFNKIWIVPDKAVVYETGHSVFVAQRHLKVMTEKDYVALQSNLGNRELRTDLIPETEVDAIADVSAQIVAEILIPEIEREVNEGKTFANLRQIYNAMILAAWYKTNLRESLLGQVYADQAKTDGVDIEDKAVKQEIYQQYLDAFKTGVFNFIREDYDPVTQEVLPRKYFSGGALGVRAEDITSVTPETLSSQPAREREEIQQNVEQPKGTDRRVTWAAVENASSDALRRAEQDSQAMQAKTREFEIQMGVNYHTGALVTSPIDRPFRVSQKDDVADITELSETEARRLEALAVESLLRGEGYISMLAAGASSRMNTAEAPEDVKALVEGDIISKAAVPVGVVEGKVYTFMDMFGINVSRLFDEIDRQAKAAGVPSRVYDNAVGFLTNDEYLPEHQSILARNAYYGLREQTVRPLLQPLGAKFYATETDVENLKSKLGEKYQQALEASREAARRVAAGDHEAAIIDGERDPLGHGDFFHQMVATGELLFIIDSGKKWVTAKNVDNIGAKFDKVWLRTLGMFLDRGVDFQPEVSPRTAGQKGGALIVMEDTGSQQLAEDPTIMASNEKRKTEGQDPVDGKKSYWFNDAVGIMSVDYIIDIYRKDSQSAEDFLEEYRNADALQRQAISERGRAKFPKLLDPKPAKKSIAVATKVETNMWQSTGAVRPEVVVKSVGVRGARNFPINEYDSMTEEQKTEAIANLRFLSTKQWSLSAEEMKKKRAEMAADLGREPTDLEFEITLETYSGNKALVDDLIRYVTTAELVSPGVVAEVGPAMRQSGRGLTEVQHEIVNRAVADFFTPERQQAQRPLSTTSEEYGKLNVDGLLSRENVQIVVMDGLNARIRELSVERGVEAADDLVTHPGRTRRTLYIDSQSYNDIAAQSEEWRRDWATHEIAHMNNPDMDESQVQAIAPLPDLRVFERPTVEVARTEVKNVGGIDLNAGLLDLQIRRDQYGVPLPVFQQPLGSMEIRGFTPVILNVAPANLPFILGQDPGAPGGSESQNPGIEQSSVWSEEELLAFTSDTE